MEKIMNKIFILSLILSSILLVGCGSDDDSKDNSKQSVDEVLSKSEAATGTPSGIDFNNKTSLRLKQEQKNNKLFRVHSKIKKIQKNILKINSSYQKEESYPCSASGTMSMDIAFVAMSKNGMNFTFNECLDYNEETRLHEYDNGMLFISTDKTTMMTTNYTSIPDYYNYPNTGEKSNLKLSTETKNGTKIFFGDGTDEEYIDDVLIKKDKYSNFKMKIETKENIEEIFAHGEIEEFEKDVKDEEIRYHNLTIKNNTVKNTFFVEGGFGYKSGCFSEYHIYNTKETDWLVSHTDNSNKWSSGTLYVDNATYRYHGSDVTVEKQDKKGEFTQQELLDEIERKKNSTDCSVK